MRPGKIAKGVSSVATIVGPRNCSSHFRIRNLKINGQVKLQRVGPQLSRSYTFNTFLKSVYHTRCITIWNLRFTFIVGHMQMYVPQIMPFQVLVPLNQRAHLIRVQRGKLHWKQLGILTLSQFVRKGPPFAHRQQFRMEEAHTVVIYISAIFVCTTIWRFHVVNEMFRL